MSQWTFDTILFMPNWKWIALAVSIVAGFILRSVARRLIFVGKNKLAQNPRLPRYVKYFIDLENQNAFAWVLTVAFWHFCLDAMDIPEGMAKYLKILIQVILFFHLIRLAYLAVEAVGKMLEHAATLTENTLDDQLAPFITKTLKVFVIIFGVLLTLQSFGFNVASVLAGLGIGGLALALAAQDTAANVFGSITIILDRPFQVGDHVKVGDTEGTIEDVGFRSTRIRTFYNSLVSIPNSIMAKEKIDNMGMRPLRRIRHTIGIEYGTPIEKMQQFMDKIRYILAAHPKTIKDKITVNFTAMGDFNLQILVNFHLDTMDLKEETQIQQEVLFEIMKTAAEMKIEFAFPTQTLLVKGTGSAPVN
jgi:MscS family membrane protein